MAWRLTLGVFVQSFHLDLDWRTTFENYFTGPLVDPFLFLFPGNVDTILSDALALMLRFHDAPAHYYYSVTEVAYLARFVEAHPELAQSLRSVGQNLWIVGGGITFLAKRALTTVAIRAPHNMDRREGGP